MMKIWAVLAGKRCFWIRFTIILLFSWHLDAAARSCLILDVDKTIVARLEKQTIPEKSELIRQNVLYLRAQNQLAIYGDDFYFIYNWAPALFRMILSYETILGAELNPRIYFFSAGEKQRIETLIFSYLQSIFPEEELARHLGNGHFKVFTHEHLRREHDPRFPTTVFFKKDIEAIGCDPKRSILFDDSDRFSPYQQQGSFLLAPTYFDASQLHMVDFQLDWSTLATNHNDLFFEVNKLAYLSGFMGQILDGLRTAHERRLPVEMTDLLRALKNEILIGRRTTSDLYNAGLHRLSQY